jgi:hypothetical protein
MKTTMVRLCLCPCCGYALDAVSSLNRDASPEEGDFTVCIECCSILRFDANMQLCESSLAHIPPHSRLEFAKVVKVCRELDRPRGSNAPGASPQ